MHPREHVLVATAPDKPTLVVGHLDSPFDASMARASLRERGYEVVVIEVCTLGELHSRLDASAPRA